MLSDGTDYFEGQNVSVVDERSEIGNRTRLSEGFYLGKRTDLLDHCPKAEGMLMMLRTMGPQIIAADEIGGCERYGSASIHTKLRLPAAPHRTWQGCGRYPGTAVPGRISAEESL